MYDGSLLYCFVDAFIIRLDCLLEITFNTLSVDVLLRLVICCLIDLTSRRARASVCSSSYFYLSTRDGTTGEERSTRHPRDRAEDEKKRKEMNYSTTAPSRKQLTLNLLSWQWQEESHGIQHNCETLQNSHIYTCGKNPSCFCAHSLLLLANLL